MHGTVIKIKFTPVIKHLQKDNTKCCLEIVPDVSCIQNLEAIEWNDENKLVEYSVPVTYKIILKRDADKDIVRKQEKIYYSCIDLRLLRLTSSTNSTLACGDITKGISDNYILSNFTTDFESTSSVSKGPRTRNETKKHIYIKEQHEINTTEELNKAYRNPVTIKEGDELAIVHNNIDVLPSLQHSDIVEDKKPIRHIFNECTVSKETITDITDIRHNKEKKRRLTITSVCTLNTIDCPAGDTVYDEAKNKSKMCLKYSSNNKTDYKMSNIRDSFDIYRYCQAISNKMRTKNVSHERILPELRVAHFMMTVENEILPLKELLSEIYRKCVSLGLLWKSKVLPEPPLTFYPKYSDQIKFSSCQERKPKCNRVVYSIVFEE